MRLLVTGGGTGGHVYPALAIVEALLGDQAGSTRREDVAWVGGSGGIEERILAREGVAFHSVPVAPLRGVGPRNMVRNVRRIRQGYGQSRELVARFRPDAVLATGGFVSVPLVLAARAGHCPSLVYLPDLRPGLAVRFLSLFAQRVAVSFGSVARYFPRRKVVVTGYPVRRALQTAEREKARRVLGLTDPDPVVLVLGGSRGAHRINEAVRGALEPLLGLAQVVHVSGQEDFSLLESLGRGLPDELRARYHLFAYLHEEMADALAASDLAVARAGAATLGEFPAVGLPAVLVPYPYAGQHQRVNAHYLADRGAAVIVDDAELGIRFLTVVRELLSDRRRLCSMSEAARALAVPEAAATIAGELLALARAGKW